MADTPTNWIERINAKVQRRIPELAEESNHQLLQDLIEEAFTDIINYSRADKYDTSWDNTLVKCVVTLYNYLGTEGSIYRSFNGIRDEYGSSDILSTILARNIPQYIKPTGYKYSNRRFDYPE